MSKCPCSSVGALAQRVLETLNDKDGARYSMSLVISHMNEGLCQIQALRPDAFAETLLYPLQAGGYQQLPPEYTALKQVHDNVAVTESGGVTQLGGVTSTRASVNKYLQNKSCLATDSCGPVATAKIESMTMNNLNPAVFTVYPPVPADGAVTVRITAVKRAPVHTANNLGACVGVDCRYESDLFNWVMMRCYELDMESAVARDLAKYYRDGFMQDYQASYLQAQREGSGYVLGQNPRNPDTDPNFKQR
jgi:hypothetical protein